MQNLLEIRLELRDIKLLDLDPAANRCRLNPVFSSQWVKGSRKIECCRTMCVGNFPAQTEGKRTLKKSFVDRKVYIFDSDRQWLWARHIVIIEKLDFAVLYRKLVNEADCKHFEQTTFSRIGQNAPKITHVEPALFISNQLE